jgi:Domain of unknown function (DUF4440)
MVRRTACACPWVRSIRKCAASGASADLECEASLMETLTQASDDLAAIERARLRAIVAADGPALWALHDPEFVLCDPGGVIWDRTRYVHGLCDGSVRYTRFEAVTPIEVLRGGDLAVVRYRSIIDLTTPHGGGHVECWHLDTYVRDATAGWRCRWSQATDTIED